MSQEEEQPRNTNQPNRKRSKLRKERQRRTRVFYNDPEVARLFRESEAIIADADLAAVEDASIADNNIAAAETLEPCYDGLGEGIMFQPRASNSADLLCERTTDNNSPFCYGVAIGLPHVKPVEGLNSINTFYQRITTHDVLKTPVAKKT